jgi:hypothetical protein
MKKAFVLFALASMSAFAAEITGFIGDASCGAKHASAADADAACAKRCTGRGDAAVLVTKDAKVYKFDAASKDKVTSFIGKSVTVNGSVKDDTITVDSIK